VEELMHAPESVAKEDIVNDAEAEPALTNNLSEEITTGNYVDILTPKKLYTVPGDQLIKSQASYTPISTAPARSVINLEAAQSTQLNSSICSDNISSNTERNKAKVVKYTKVIFTPETVTAKNARKSWKEGQSSVPTLSIVNLVRNTIFIFMANLTLAHINGMDGAVVMLEPPETKAKVKNTSVETPIRLMSKSKMDINRWKLQNEIIGDVLLSEVPNSWVTSELKFVQGVEVFEVSQQMERTMARLAHTQHFLVDHMPNAKPMTSTNTRRVRRKFASGRCLSYSG
jgi:hypothetical protein